MEIEVAAEDETETEMVIEEVEDQVPQTDVSFAASSAIGKYIEEIDLIRSGLDDMMIDGFQSVKKEFIETENIQDFRTAAFKVAIEKIALAYDSIGL